MALVGSSGSGKTASLMNILKIMNGTFHTITIITKNKDECLYNYLAEISKPKKEKDEP